MATTTRRSHAGPMSRCTPRSAGGGIALYRADLDRGAVRRLNIAGDLERAIESDELRLAYQPILDIPTRRILRVEALVRWQHPTLGLLPPKEFVDLASLSGMIRPLTNWVVDRSLAQAKNWHTLGIDLGVSVNLSARNLFDAELPSFIASRLRARATGRDPDRRGERSRPDGRSTGRARSGRTHAGVRCPHQPRRFRHRIVLARDPAGSAHPRDQDRRLVRSPRLEDGDRSARPSCGRSSTSDETSASTSSPKACSAPRRSPRSPLGCHLAQGYHIGPPMSAGAVGLVAAATQEPTTVDLRDD